MRCSVVLAAACGLATVSGASCVRSQAAASVIYHPQASAAIDYARARVAVLEATADALEGQLRSLSAQGSQSNSSPKPRLRRQRRLLARALSQTQRSKREALRRLAVLERAAASVAPLPPARVTFL